MIREYLGNFDYIDLSRILYTVFESNIDQDTLENYYLGENKHILVAVDDANKLQGFALVEFRYDHVRSRKFGYITYLAIDEKYRNHGIGKELLIAVEKLCKDHKCSAIELTSANFRTTAHLFYGKMGFTKKATTVFIKELSQI